MSKLMISVAGIRGIVGDSLTPDVIVRYVSAYSRLMNKGTIVVGRDSRLSGKAISNLICSILNMCGRDVIDIDIATTPTVAMAIQLYEAAGGIAITASHNPVEWNALKFMDDKTLFLNEMQGEQLHYLLTENRFIYETYDKIGSTKLEIDESRKYHIQKILDIPYINKSDIRKRAFKVAIDCVNGAGSVILPVLLQDLGCSVTKINCEPNGIFPHGAEPLPENLGEICSIMEKGNFDIGMVVDPDSDRLALISENGDPLGEEYTLAMAVDLILSKKISDIAINVSTSRATEDIARKYGCNTFRTKVGEINVSTVMLEKGLTIGGEGNGGVILPEIHPGRDALIGAAIILQYLTEKEKFVSEIFAELPAYQIVKDKVSVEGINFDAKANIIIENTEKESIDLTDGIKINGIEDWVQLRKSNTEPIVRIFAEAKTREAALNLVKKYKDMILE
ncbi:MAG: phosphoglucosamine mutase [Candidatus Delongbacteria bacterium]|nr:phosphoglucosamine mutase [Candidatus Delongbacteria bacterium]MCG2760898.1 phosphoglucosamine mutase [Candidatus Delongbacteria bacterium]